MFFNKSFINGFIPIATNILWSLKDFYLGHERSSVEERIPRIKDMIGGWAQVAKHKDYIDFDNNTGPFCLSIRFNSKNTAQHAILKLGGKFKGLELFIDSNVSYISSSLEYNKLNGLSKKLCERLAEPDYDIWFREIAPFGSLMRNSGVEPVQFMGAVGLSLVIVAMADGKLSPNELQIIQEYMRVATGAKLNPQELNEFIQKQVDFVNEHSPLTSIDFIKQKILPNGHQVDRTLAEGTLGACMSLAMADGECSDGELKCIAVIAMHVFGYQKIGRILNFLISDREKLGEDMSSARVAFAKGIE